MLKKALMTCGIAVLWLAVAAAPQAGASVFAAEKYSSELSSEQVEEVTFGTEAGTLKCKKLTFTSSLARATSSVSLSPAFLECTAFGFPATVSANGCQYVVHSGEETGSKVFGGTLDISCPAGKTLVVAAGTCEVQIGTQSALKSVTLTDEATSPAKIGLSFGITGATYNVTKDPIGCPFSGTGVRTKGTMGGKASIGVTSATAGIFVLGEAAAACETEEGEECPQGKDYALPLIIKASAPAAQITVGGGITVQCAEAKLELELIGHQVNTNFAARGLEWDFNPTKGCKTSSKGTACTPVASEGPFMSEIKPVVKPNAEWIVTLIKLKIVCGAEVVCRYGKAKEPVEVVGGSPALLEAKSTAMELDAIPGEANCGTEAKIATLLTVKTPNPLSFIPVKK